MVSISDLNKRERVVRKSLSDLERQMKKKKISTADYNKMKKVKEGELKKIELERKNIIAKLPPMPLPPKPSRAAAPAKPPAVSSDAKRVQTELKKHEKDLLFTQSEMSKLFAEVVKNRERIRKIEDMVKSLSSAQTQTPKVDIKSIDQRFSGQIDRMNVALKDSATKTKTELDRVSGDIRGVKREIDELKKVGTSFKTLDISGLRRDIESLKEKSKWLEQQVGNLDIEPLYELIKEIEDRVSTSSRVAPGPVIIE